MIPVHGAATHRGPRAVDNQPRSTATQQDAGSEAPWPEAHGTAIDFDGLIGAKQGNAKQREVVAVSDSARVALRAGETLRKQIETLRKQIERLPAKHYTLKVTPMSAMTPRPAMKPATIAAIEYGMAPKLARSAFISL